MSELVYIASCHKQGGIYRFALSCEGKLTYLDHLELDRVMYMVLRDKRMYTLLLSPFGASSDSGLAVLCVSDDGALSFDGKILSTQGVEACQLAVDKEDIYIANYSSGSVFKADQLLVKHTGMGVHPVRQASAHPHQAVVTPDKKYVCIVDLGLDTIFVYNRMLQKVSELKLDGGQGARHLVFSKDGRAAFCVNELGSSITALTYHDGVFNQQQSYSTLPYDFTGENTAAAIRITPDGRYLYASNRGHDSIACFSVSEHRLKLMDIVSCGGGCPRDINISPSGEWLISANQAGNNGSVFKIVSGKLILTDRIEGLLSPLCVCFQMRE